MTRNRDVFQSKTRKSYLKLSRVVTRKRVCSFTPSPTILTIFLRTKISLKFLSRYVPFGKKAPFPVVTQTRAHQLLSRYMMKKIGQIKFCSIKNLRLIVGFNTNHLNQQLSFLNDSEYFEDTQVDEENHDEWCAKDVEFTKPRERKSIIKLDLTETAIISQRYSVSAAHITSTMLHAALKAAIIVREQYSDIKSALFIYKSKIRRAKIKNSLCLKRCFRDNDPIKTQYFHGRLTRNKYP